MNTPPLEPEIVPQTQALAVREAQAVAPSGLFGTQEPVAIIERATSVATALKAVITRQGLISRISGKEYPKCEAWTLLGTMLGVFPVCCWSKPVEGGWEARVEARTKDGAIVGAAEAQCLRSESNWKNRDDFALRSMAQTRATAKCLRMPLGFVMTLAGYEPTPAEEMVAETPTRQRATGAKSPPPPPADDPAPEPPLPPPFPTEESRRKMIAALKAAPGDPNRDIVTEYWRKLTDPAALMPHEEIEDLPLRFVPATTGEMRALADKVAGFGNGEPAAWAYKPHIEPEPAKPAKAAKAAKPISHEGLEELRGTVEAISTKNGSSGKGPWTLTGVKIGEVWANTFDTRLGGLAEDLKGRAVIAWIERGSKGINLKDIEEAQ